MPDVTLTIDGTRVTVPAGTLLVEAAKAVDTDVPVYCYHPKLGPAGLCRICLVDIEKAPKLQIACNTVVTEGMAVHTFGPKVEAGRRAVMEFLLLNHPLDCPICDKGGECDLQDYSMAYGSGSSRLADAKSSKPKAIDLGPTIVLDDERCIVCQRCSRFDEIITNERSLVVKDRGQRDVIATASGEPYRSNFSGNVTELCPVGALTSKTYRFKSRPWDNHRTETSCTQCAVGCRTNVDERYRDVQRTMSVPTDDRISDGWLCDRGRYNVGFLSDDRRITGPLLRQGDDFVQIAWDDAIERWAMELRRARDAGGPGAIGAIGGARLLNEEQLLLAATFRGFGVENIDWRAGRQRQATPGAYGGTYDDLERAQVIVALGRPPAQTAPVLDLRIRKAVTRRGARYVTVGMHPAESFVPSLHVASLEELEPSLEGVARVALVWDGIDPSLGASAEALLGRLVARGATAHAFVPGEQNNARGAHAAGLLPREGGAHATAMLRAARGGSLHLLSLFGVNPVLSHPWGADDVRAALAAVPFLVATDLFLTDTARLAHLILPARAALEKSGHVYDLAGDLLEIAVAHEAPAGVLADGEMLVALADALGVAIPSPDDLESAAIAPLRAGDALGDAAYDDGATIRTDEGGLRLAIASDIFAGGGTVLFDDRLGALRPQPTATLAPVTARALGVADGDLVDVRGRGDRAMRDLVVRISPDAREDVVRVVDGVPAAPANGHGDGESARIVNIRSARVATGGLV